MAQYSVPRSGYTPSTTNVDIAVTTSSTSIDRVVEVFVGGEATASTVNRNLVRRHSANGATPTAITATKMNNRSGANGFTGASTFTTAPTFGGTLLTLAYNAFGGIIRWVAAPGEEIYFVANTAGDNEGSLASGSGTGTQSAHVIVEEM